MFLAHTFEALKLLSIFPIVPKHISFMLIISDILVLLRKFVSFIIFVLLPLKPLNAHAALLSRSSDEKGILRYNQIRSK